MPVCYIEKKGSMSSTPKRLNLRFVLSATLLGNTLEWYDYSTYAFLIPIFTHIFFTVPDHSLALLQSLMIYAFGLFSRPLGGILFGYIGDRWGRKVGLILSVALMALPVLCIGSLPSYAQIGLAAPLILASMRFLQGIVAGGEFPGVIIYLVETSPQNQRGYFGSFVFIGVIMGLLLGLVEYCLIDFHLSQKELYDWGWRLTFLFGFILAGSTFYLRKKLHETPLYEKSKRHSCIEKDPLKGLFLNYKKVLGLLMGVELLATLSFKTIVLFLTVYLHQYLGLPFNTAILLNLGLLVFLLICLPIIGKACNRFGPRLIVRLAAGGIIILSYPLFALLNHPSLMTKSIALALLGILWSGYSAPLPVLYCELFPTPVRFSGVSISYNLIAGPLGGLLALLIFFLMNKFQNPLIPSFFLIGAAFISLLSLKLLRKQPVYLRTV